MEKKTIDFAPDARKALWLTRILQPMKYETMHGQQHKWWASCGNLRTCHTFNTFKVRKIVQYPSPSSPSVSFVLYTSNIDKRERKMEAVKIPWGPRWDTVSQIRLQLITVTFKLLQWKERQNVDSALGSFAVFEALQYARKHNYLHFYLADDNTGIFHIFTFI